MTQIKALSVIVAEEDVLYKDEEGKAQTLKRAQIARIEAKTARGFLNRRRAAQQLCRPSQRRRARPPALRPVRRCGRSTKARRPRYVP